MPREPVTDEIVRQGLRARAFALHALSPAFPKPAGALPDVCGASPCVEGWRLFLKRERCAHPLREALRAADRLGDLPDTFANVLAEEAEWELARIAQAEAHLESIAAWAVEHGRRPVVLKGGVTAITDARVDVSDLDVLLSRKDAEDLVAGLAERGYRSTGFSSPIHYNAISRNGEIPVEIHHTLEADGTYGYEDYPHRFREIPSRPGLWQMTSHDFLWHVLTHSVVKHPACRGRIRDLLLLRSAVADCRPEEIEAVRRRCGTHELAATLGPALDQALRFGGRRPGEDPFEWLAVVAYALGWRRSNRTRVHPNAGMVNRWVFALLLGPAERRDMWRKVWTRSTGPSGNAIIRRAQAVGPRFGRAVQLAARLVVRIATLSQALPLALWASRAVRRHRPAPRAGAGRRPAERAGPRAATPGIRAGT